MREPWYVGLGRRARPEEVRLIAIDAIVENPDQPRRVFAAASLDELAQSIREFGVIQPVVVRTHGDRFQLVAGERRWRAARLAGLAVLPALVREVGDGEGALVALVENLQREDLNPLEEARGYQRLLAELNITQEQLAERVGKSQSTIANKLRLLKLSEPVQLAMAAGRLTERHGRALLHLDEARQHALLDRVLAGNLTVRETEELAGVASAAPKPASSRRKRRVLKVFKDLRIFVNTFRTAVATLRAAGFAATMEERDTGDSIIVTVRVPKEPG